MDFDLEKTLAQIDGQNIEKFMLNRLTDKDREQINTGIEIAFRGYSLHNWLQKDTTLAQAWNKATEQLRIMTFSFTQNNPAVIYARQAAFDFKAKWQQKTRSVDNLNQTIQCPPEREKQWANKAQSDINTGIGIIKQKIMEFETNPGDHTQTPQNQNTIKQNVHERINKHERIRK